MKQINAYNILVFSACTILKNIVSLYLIWRLQYNFNWQPRRIVVVLVWRVGVGRLCFALMIITNISSPPLRTTFTHVHDFVKSPSKCFTSTTLAFSAIRYVARRRHFLWILFAPGVAFKKSKSKSTTTKTKTISPCRLLVYYIFDETNLMFKLHIMSQ